MVQYIRTPLFPILIISLIALIVQWKSILQQPEQATDYSIYYQAAGTFAKDPLQLYPSSPAGFDQFIYPPPSILLFRLFHLLPEKTSYFLFVTCMYGCLIASVLLCLSMLRQAGGPDGTKTMQTLGYLIFALASAPVYHNMRLGQINCLVLLLSLCYLHFLRKIPLLAGILLAAAIWIKLYPVLLLFPAFFIPGSKKAILSCILSCALVPLLFLPWITPFLYLDFAHKMAGMSRYASAHIINQSVSAFGLRLTVPGLHWFQWPNIYLLPSWLKTGNLLLLLFLLVRVGFGAHRKNSALLWGAVMLAAGASLSPLGWGHTYVYTLPLLLIGIKEMEKIAAAGSFPAWLGCLSAALLFLIPVYNHPAFLDRWPALVQDIYYSRLLCLTLFLIFFVPAKFIFS